MDDAPTQLVYKGITFRRYPDAKRRADQVYFTPGIADRERGVQRLHQEIWKDAHDVEKIPAGYHVHHEDENPFNNDPANLVLVDGSNHLAAHARTEKWREARKAWEKAGQDAARAWHGTPEGLEFHRQLGVKVWEQTEEREFTCEQCGNVFLTRTVQDKVRFCSNNCKSKARRVSGVDDEERTCPVCGDTFTINRYVKTAHCSRKCSAVTAQAKRDARRK